MSIASRLGIVAVAASSLGACVPDLGTQQITGKVALIGQADLGEKMITTTEYDASVITVCGWCPFTDGGGRTCFCTGITDPSVEPTGDYALHQEVAGPNQFWASAPSTLEKSVQFTVDGDGNVDAPNVALTAIGTVSGTVTGLPALAGVVVAVDGTSLVATTDSQGKFEIDGVISGAQTLTAFEPGSATVAAAHAAVLVPYAAVVTTTMAFVAM